LLFKVEDEQVVTSLSVGGSNSLCGLFSFLLLNFLGSLSPFLGVGFLDDWGRCRFSDFFWLLFAGLGCGVNEVHEFVNRFLPVLLTSYLHTLDSKGFLDKRRLLFRFFY